MKKQDYINMEYAGECLTDIDELLQNEGIQKTVTSWRKLLDDSSMYILTARDKDTKQLEGYAIYQIQSGVAMCKEIHGNEHAITALPKAAQGYMRWKGARTISKLPP